MITSKPTKNEKLNNFLNRQPVQDWIKSITGLTTLKIVVPKLIKAQETNETYNFFFEDVLYKIGLMGEILFITVTKKYSGTAIFKFCPIKFEW
jgi:hypothetical protein